jgi:hypothetical protein
MLCGRCGKKRMECICMDACMLKCVSIHCSCCCWNDTTRYHKRSSSNVDYRSLPYLSHYRYVHCLYGILTHTIYILYPYCYCLLRYRFTLSIGRRQSSSWIFGHDRHYDNWLSNLRLFVLRCHSQGYRRDGTRR